MTPEELAALHPKLFHITHNPWESIEKHGLLCTSALLDLFEIQEPKRSHIERWPRVPGILLEDPKIGSVKLNDNVPLIPTALEKCLEDGYANQIELCPINSGVTFRKAAKRGLNTFTPMEKYSYKEWKKLRGKNDVIQEITVLGQIKNIQSFTLKKYERKNEK